MKLIIGQINKIKFFILFVLFLFVNNSSFSLEFVNCDYFFNSENYEKNSIVIDKKNNVINHYYILTDKYLNELRNMNFIVKKIQNLNYELDFINNDYVTGYLKNNINDVLRFENIEINLKEKFVRKIYEYENGKKLENNFSCESLKD